MNILSFKVCTNILIIALLMAQLQSSASAAASVQQKGDVYNARDTAVYNTIERLGNGLFYPQSVKRFYMRSSYKPVWLANTADTKPVWDAMLTLDCLSPYGLTHSDYHPDKLTIKELHTLLDSPKAFNAARRIQFEVMLTDAMIRLMNHLHYGKFNPDVSEDKIDETASLNYRAEDRLFDALQQKQLERAIQAAQPAFKPYTLLQDYMRLIKLQYTGDCYETPEETIRLIAMNMERLRWVNSDGLKTNFVLVNIPAHRLEVYDGDAVTLFDALIGKEVTPTQSGQSTLAYITTNTALLPCGDAVAQLQFNMAQGKQLVVHSTTSIVYKPKAGYAVTPSCIQVKDARKLAVLLLQMGKTPSKVTDLNKALLKKSTRNISITGGIPVLATYLTCENRNGIIRQYNDVYGLDKRLELAMYPNLSLSLNK